MDLGTTLRRARERHRLSLAGLANAAGVNVGYLSQLENGQREPSLTLLRKVADVLDLEPVVLLMPRGDTMAAKLESMRTQTPGQRLTKAAPDLYDALGRLLAVFPTELIVSGAAAAVAQGLPVPVECLDVVLPDSDEVVERLIDVLRRTFAIYVELSVAEYRSLGRAMWPIGLFDVNVLLTDRPPVAVPLDLGGWIVQVATLPEVAAGHPPVAAMLERLTSTAWSSRRG